MSGIAGLFRLDGSAFPPADLQRMVEVLAHRGPDGAGTWQDGGVGLGHRLLHTTPESLVESLPSWGAEGTVVLTADARIDNRAELIRVLGLQNHPGPITDSDLILRSYVHWGEACPEHLLGDFSFAIWDARRSRLFCARDHFGVKPFYYHHQSGRLFAFASEIKALLALDAVPRVPNEQRIRDFLTRAPIDLTSTFYGGIHRLPPAHTLTVTREHLSIRRYWTLELGDELRLASSDAYAEAFREHFFEAVRCRLRSAHPVGSTLSGGLDSSSNACTARHLLQAAGGPPLHTFSLVFDATPDCDERPFMNAALALGGFEPHFVLADELSPVEEADRFLWHLEEPFYASNLAFQWGMNRAARRLGVRVMLDGFHGDETVGYGFNHFAELLRGGRMLSLAALIRQYSRNTGWPAWYTFKKLAAGPIAPPGLVDLWHRRPGRPPVPYADLDSRTLELVGSDIRGSAADAAPARASRWALGAVSPREEHRWALTSPSNALVLEIEDRVTAAFAVEARYPFLDKRLIEFAVAVPTAQKIQGGWTRSLIRRAMAGVLPDAIRWRSGKGHLETWYFRALLKYEQPRLERLVFDDAELLRPYVNLAALRQAYEQYRTTGDGTSSLLLWKPLVLAHWLRQERADLTTGDPTTGKGGARTRPQLAVPQVQST